MKLPFFLLLSSLSILSPFHSIGVAQSSQESAIREVFLEESVGKGFCNAALVKRGDLVHSRLLLAEDMGEFSASLDGLVGQIEDLTARYSAGLSSVAKLNLYVSVDFMGSGGGDAVTASLRRYFPGALPAISLIPASLPSYSPICGDVVFLAGAGGARSETDLRNPDAAILPADRDILYVSGRAASGSIEGATAETMEELFRVLKHLEVGAKEVVQVKAFLQPIKDWRIVEREIVASFGAETVPPIVYVEWSSSSRAVEIELIASAAAQSETPQGLRFVNPPWDKTSPVFSRAVRVDADELIYTGGLYSQIVGTGDDEVHSVFDQLERLMVKSGSDLKHLAKASYYVSEEAPSKSLNALRPSYYDPQRPPAASKVQIRSVGHEGLGLLIDMIAVPAP